MSGRVVATQRQLIANDCRPDSLGPFTRAFQLVAVRLGLTEEQFADRLGIPASTWSKQKSGSQGHRMHVQRFDTLTPTDLEAAVDAVLDELARFRGRVVVRRGGQLAYTADALRAVANSLDQVAGEEPEQS